MDGQIGICKKIEFAFHSSVSMSKYSFFSANSPLTLFWSCVRVLSSSGTSLGGDVGLIGQGSRIRANAFQSARSGRAGRSIHHPATVSTAQRRSCGINCRTMAKILRPFRRRISIRLNHWTVEEHHGGLCHSRHHNISVLVSFTLILTMCIFVTRRE